MNTKSILKIAVPLFIIHAVEEYSRGLMKLDPFFRWIGSKGLPVFIFYVGEQILLVTLLVWAIYQPKRWILILAGLLFIFEISHVISAIQVGGYYPGLVTGVMLIILGGFYWKGLL